MKKGVIFLLFLCITLTLNAQRRVIEPVKPKLYNHFISLNYQAGSASGFYDLSGGFITTMWDSTSFYDSVNKEFIHREYIFELQKTTFELAFGYSFLENTYFEASLPISWYNLSEKYLTKFIYDSLGRQIGSLSNASRESKSLNKIDYLSLGGKYLDTVGQLTYGGKVEVQIPFGTQTGQLDSSITFLSDGAFSTIFEAFAGYTLSKISFDVSAKYHLRTEDFKNQIQTTFYLSYQSVENTYIRGFVELVRSTESFDGVPLLSYYKDVVQEDYLAFGFGSKLLLGSDYFAEFDYIIRTSGRNSLNYNNFKIIVGYAF